jgi:hypothetical protein
MTNISPAPVAPITFGDLADAIRAARGAEPLSPRQRHALGRPPASFVVDESTAAADGFHGCRGRIDVFEYATFLLARHAERLAVVERAIEVLRTKAALPIDQIESLARKIAGLKPIPDTLADALEMLRDPPRSRAADRFESLMKIYASNAARNQRVRIV